MPMPLISVVIPSYNHARYIGEAIDSVLAQPVELEVLVRDDASTDGSWAVLQGIRDPRVRIWRNESNLGAHENLQRLLADARGDYLAILDSDDRYAPGRLARCLQVLEQGNCDLLGSDIRLIDGEGAPVAAHWWIDAFGELKAVWRETGDWAATLLSGNVFMTTSNFVFTRRLWQRLAPFSTHRYVHDYDFVLRALAGGARLAWIDEALLDYRLHASNTISEKPLAANLEASSLLREHAPALLSAPGDVAMRTACLNGQWARIERYEVEILRALQHEALVRKDEEWGRLVDDRDKWIAERDQWIAERDGWIADRDRWIAERDGWIAERDRRVAEQEARLAQAGAEIAAFRRAPLKAAARIRARAAMGWLRGLRAQWRGLALPGRAQMRRVGGFSGLRRIIERRERRVAALSFDIFDTLLARCIEPPERVVHRVATLLAQRLELPVEQVLAQRQIAERALREEALAAGHDHECHYDEIVERWIAGLLPAADAVRKAALVQFAEDCEFDLERLALRAKPNARLFLEWARGQGIRVIAVSDMYLGKRHLRRLLDELGYRGLIDRIYVSSEYRAGKYSGRLFGHVLEQEGLRPEDVLHVGDNFLSDAMAPCRLGMAGVFLDERHERRRRRRQQTSAALSVLGGVWPGRMMAEVLAERLYLDDRAKRDEVYFQYGLEVLGPIFSTFVHGLIERVRRDRPEKLFFLARDGALFMRMYEEAGALLGETLPPACYAYASRRVVAGAAVAEGLDHARAVVGLYNPKQHGLESILKTYGLNPGDFADLARRHGFTHIGERLDDWNDARLLAFLDDAEVQQRIRPAGQQARELLRGYFDGLGFFAARRVALVDIGWNATIQRFLEDAFAGKADAAYPQVDGYYFAFMNGMHQGALAHGGIDGLMLDVRRAEPQERAASDFEELFEQGARALHATTIGYRRTADGVEPVLKDDAAPDRQAELRCNPHIEALQQGVMLCFEHYLAAQRLTGFGFDAVRPYALALAERAVVYPTRAEVAAISKLAHSEDFGHDHLLDLSGRDVGWRDFLRPRLLARKLAMLPWRYAPFARFRTPLASAAARVLHLLQLKRRAG